MAPDNRRPLRRVDLTRAAAAMATAIMLIGCGRGEPIPSVIPPPELTAHEAYGVALDNAGLDGTTLVDRWREAADGALAAPITIDPPFREVVFYPGDAPTATAYRVTLERGQALGATVDVEPDDPVGVFLDVYAERASGNLVRVASASAGMTDIQFEPLEEGTFVLRIQPELLRSVRVTVSVLRGATLAFPVLGRRTYDIGSRFGAPREGGRRSHHGVDIFAPRGTPVVAVTAGRVSRVEDTRVGGRVVWMRDDRRQSLYYAHLDRQLVAEGDRVTAGDTLGLVGNTGNARTTPPHLHFGIYARGRGPVDPFPYINPPSTRAPEIRADSSRLGEWVRLADDARLRSIADGGSRDLTLETSALAAPNGDLSLPRHTILRLLGVFEGSQRVLLPDGGIVTLRNARFESISGSIEQVALEAGVDVLDRPTSGAIRTGKVEAGRTATVLGRYGSYRLVQATEDLEGWIAGSP